MSPKHKIIIDSLFDALSGYDVPPGEMMLNVNTRRGDRSGLYIINHNELVALIWATLNDLNIATRKKGLIGKMGVVVSLIKNYHRVLKS